MLPWTKGNEAVYLLYVFFPLSDSLTFILKWTQSLKKISKIPPPPLNYKNNSETDASSHFNISLAHARTNENTHL